MDKITRREWELFDISSDLPTIQDLNKFLKQRCDLLEKLEVSNKSYPRETENKGNKAFDKGYRGTQKYNAYTGYQNQYDKSSLSCYYCKQNHTIFRCEKFLKLTNAQRSTEVRRLRLCYNCLRPSHDVKDCQHSGCKKCEKYHNTILHVEFVPKPENQNNDLQTKVQLLEKDSGVAALVKNSCDNKNDMGNGSDLEKRESVSMHAMEGSYNNTIESSQVILSTAVVKTKDSMGNLHECRSLLDSGAQSNFITERLCKKLKLKLDEGKFSIAGIGHSLAKIQHKTRIKIYSCDRNYKTVMDCLVMPRITDKLPVVSFDRKNLNIPQGIKLADTRFNESNSIDLLIGSAIFWELIGINKLQLEDSKLALHETRLGWIVEGTTPLKVVRFTPDTFHQISCLSLDDSLTRFWEIEEIDNNSKILSEGEQFCETHFLENLERSKEGKFIVSIPFKDDIQKLGKSKEKSRECFYSQEARLEKNSELKKEYVSFMNEYLRLGHMREVNEKESNSGVSYYMPHHAVVRDDSKTTRVRVVFNVSMKTHTGVSFNDVQHIGPTVQDELLAILLRFRKHEFVMTADISKMYRMIWLKDDLRCLQRIFWRENPSDEVKCFELNIVTYGTASAPFLAVRCLTQLSIENSETYPRASQSIRTSFYMDDYLEGAVSEEELLKLQADVSTILSSAGFQLRKWLCNKRDLCSKFQLNEDLDSNVVIIGENESNKTRLGIFWNANSDDIQFSVSNINSHQMITKLSILSIVSQIYDPLGLINPVIIIAKLLIQSLWEAKIGWEGDVPDIG